MKKNYHLEIFKKEMLDEVVDLFIDTFTKDPWYDEFESREQVMTLFLNNIKNNYFLGYVLKEDDTILALSIGFKKPWINGMEYYIDQFCVSYNFQNKGIGSTFMKLIEEDIRKNGMDSIILNTEKGYPSEQFYLANGFKVLEEFIILAK